MSKLLAPNGKPSNLTPEQYKLVRSKEFISWFGDWENDPANASKVVDSNGEPLVVYHGTPYGGFYEFDLSNIGKSTIPYWGKGIYLTASKSYAKGYAESRRTETQKIYNLFAKCLNPYIVKRHLMGRGSYMKMVEENQYNDFNNFLIDNNYDSVIILDGDNIKDAIEIMTPLSNQIKLADGNNTTFDGSNPDIRFDTGGNVDEFYIGKTYSGKQVRDIVSKYESQEGTDMEGFAVSHIKIKDKYILDYVDIETLIQNDSYLHTFITDQYNPNNDVDYEDIRQPILLGTDEYSKQKNTVLDGYHRILQQLYNKESKIFAFIPFNNSDIRFDEGGEVNIGLFSQIWGWFGIKF